MWKTGASNDVYRTPKAIIELVDGKNDLRRQFAELAEKMKSQGKVADQSN